ncbi:MAG: OmpA family protein [Candidatus Sulfotelmatobacter sp.]|jgi:outer membrane protein OmpA-like peptidoglycan-associated protein
MKTRIFVTLFLAIVLALPAFAQQTNSNSAAPQAAPAGQAAPADTREPLPPPTSRDFWDGDDPNLVNLLTHPYARKAWVKRQVGPIRDRINELDEITSENANKIRDTDTRSQQGLQLASEKTNLADQHASDAANKAQTAKLAATDASTHVSNAEEMVGNLDQYKPSSQTEIRFRPGQTVLSKQAKDALDQMAAPLPGQRSYVIEVRGFSPGRGQAAIVASQKMADSVVRYLVLTRNIPVYRIYTVGMGNAPVTGEAEAKRPTAARVEVSLLRNDVLSAQR